MTVVGVVGGYHRECVASFVNPLIIAGVVTEVRICKHGDENQVENLVRELCLLGDTDKICAVGEDDLICRNEVYAEVLVFLNTSYKTFEEFSRISYILLKVVVEKLIQFKIETLHVVFGDNYRGLVLKNLFDRLAKLNKCPTGIKSVAVSSIFQVSKTFNSSAIEDGMLRSYPKMDGSSFTYDPSDSLSPDSIRDVALEMESQMNAAEKLFAMRTARDYPTLEGTILYRFVSIYIQSGWTIACRDDGLYARCPTAAEVLRYRIQHHDIAVFLPPTGDEGTDWEMLPDPVRKHVREGSDFVKLQIDKICN